MATTIPCKIHIPLRLPRPLNPTNPPASKTARPANCQLLVGRAGPSTYPPLLSLKSAAAARPNLHSPNSWPAVQCNEGFCNASEGQRLPLTTAMASQKPHHSANSGNDRCWHFAKLSDAVNLRPLSRRTGHSRATGGHAATTYYTHHLLTHLEHKLLEQPAQL
jgi:hypothetical protein